MLLHLHWSLNFKTLLKLKMKTKIKRELKEKKRKKHAPRPISTPLAQLPLLAGLFISYFTRAAHPSSWPSNTLTLGPGGEKNHAAPAFPSLFGGTGLSVTHRLPSWDPHPSCIFVLIAANRCSPSLEFIAILRVPPCTHRSFASRSRADSGSRWGPLVKLIPSSTTRSASQDFRAP